MGFIGTTCTALPVNTQVAASYMAIPPAPMFPLYGGPFNSVSGLVSKTWYRIRIPIAFDQYQADLCISKIPLTDSPKVRPDRDSIGSTSTDCIWTGSRAPCSLESERCNTFIDTWQTGAERRLDTE